MPEKFQIFLFEYENLGYQIKSNNIYSFYLMLYELKEWKSTQKISHILQLEKICLYDNDNNNYNSSNKKNKTFLKQLLLSNKNEISFFF